MRGASPPERLSFFNYMGQFVDITGLRFGRITVINLAGTSKNGKKVWNCVCDCGNSKQILSGSLLSGRTKSCGCFSVDNSREKATKHGYAYSNIYEIYKSMKSRCYNKNEKCYHVYGGRGIVVCDRWLSSVKLFAEDMGPRPSPSHSIDRIDNDGNYEPGNCRWATKKEQSNNNSRNHRIDFMGLNMTIQQWSEYTGIKRATIHSRIKRGCSLEETFAAVVRR